MPDYFTEDNTPSQGDSTTRSLQKINDLLLSVPTTLSLTQYVDAKAADYDAAGTASGLMTWHETNWDHDTFAVIPRKSTIWVPARAMIARTTSGAAAGTTETTTNKVMLATFDFDKDADEFAQFTIGMPKSWNGGTFTARFCWTTVSGGAAQTVAWGIQGSGYIDGDAIEQAWGTAIVTSDTWQADSYLHWSAESAAITPENNGGNANMTAFQVFRDISADDLAGDALLIGVQIHFTENASTDA